MEYFILFVPPILQIIFIGFRLAHKITIPIGAVTILTTLSEVILSIVLLKKATGPAPFVEALADTFSNMIIATIGFYITLIGIPIIGCIGAIIWYTIVNNSKRRIIPYQNY